MLPGVAHVDAHRLVPAIRDRREVRVWSALNDYLDALPVKTASGVRTADLADALVVNKAKITAQYRNEP